MALDAILIAQINANTQAINKLNEDARKTSELPLMPVLDVNSLIRVEFGGISKHVKASQFAPPNAEFLEYIFNKQNDLSPDGTGVKYPTVDAVIDGLLLQKEYTDTLVADLVKVDKTNFKDIYQTGILRIDLDVSVLTVSPADTLTITACNNLLFVNEIAPDTPANLLGDYLKSFGNKSFVANGTNTPLPVNTRGIFYVGLDKLGNQVYRTAKVYDQDIAYLARMVVENNGGVYTIVLNRYMPDLANNRINNRDRFVIASGSLVPSGAPSISFGNRGMSFYKNSINYATNKFDPNYLALADSVNPTPANFLFYLPNITNLAVSLATSTTINPTQWYTAGGALGGTAVNGTNYQVYKVYLSVTGTIIIQTKASTSNAPEAGVNAIFANRESALAGLTSTVFPQLTPVGDYIALGTFFLRAGTAVNGSQMNDPNDFYFQAFTTSSSSSSVGVTEHDLLSGKNTNPAFQHVTSAEKVDWNTAFADRYKWDGSASGLDALLGRTSLGGTTIGQNLFTSPNPSAVRFLRANADNSISWLDANTFRTAIGAGTGNGTGNGSVTSVDLLAPTGLAVTGNPITTAGTLVLAYQAGYSIPTDAKQANWDTAFGWGNHASAGYAFSNGSNATGTWGINITGNAGSATNWGNRQANFDTLSTDVLRLLVIDSPTGIARQVDKSVIQSYLGINGGSFILNQNASAQTANMWISGNGQFNGGVLVNIGNDNNGFWGFNTANSNRYWFNAYTSPTGDGLMKIFDSSQTDKVFLNTNGVSYLNGGNVGIGTPDPQRKTDIYTDGGSAVSHNYLRLGLGTAGAYGGSNNIEFSFNDYGNVGGRAFDNVVAKIAGITDIVDPSNIGGVLGFYTKPRGGVYTDAPLLRMAINFNGNVTIDTADNGSGKLQVGGNITSTYGSWANIGNYTWLGGSGGDYGSVGYNIGYTPSGNVYNYAVSDTSSMLRFDVGGFRFMSAPSGAIGTPITYSDLAILRGNGNFSLGGVADNGTRLQIYNGGIWSSGTIQVDTNGGLFNFRSTTPANNYGTFRQNDGSALAYLGDANGSALGGGGVNDFGVVAPSGKLFLQASTNVYLNAFGSGKTILNATIDNLINGNKLQVNGGITATRINQGDYINDLITNTFKSSGNAGSFHTYFVNTNPANETYGVGIEVANVSSTGMAFLVSTGFADRFTVRNDGVVAINNPLTANQLFNVNGLMQSIDSKNQYLKIGMEGDIAVITADWFSGYGGAFRPLSFRVGGDEKFNISISGVLTVPYLGNGSETRLVTVSPAGQIGSTVLPKKYIVQLQQNGSGAPAVVATVASTLSDTPVISYIGTGQYRIASADFSNGSKMNIQLNQGVSVAEGSVRARKGSGAWIDLNTYNTSQLLSNDVISIQYCTIDVEIYP